MKNNSPTLCTRGMHYLVLAGLLCLTLLTAVTAADFSGSLNSVAITDAQVTNKPPIAVFTYRRDGETITFNASGSSDPDGSITKYKWDFGNGPTSEGVTTTYTLTNTANLRVTLTVVDNKGGVTLSQQTITPSSTSIVDDFSTDTSANYARLFGTGTLGVTGGHAHVTPSFSGWSLFSHTTSIGKPDMHVWGNVDNQPESGGLAFRVSTSNHTCYVAYFTSLGYLTIRGFPGTPWGATELYSSGTYATGSRLVDITITGTSLIAMVDGVAAITATVSEFSTGDYAGIIIYRESSDSKIYDFNAGAN